jgi:hypothetical protein
MSLQGMQVQRYKAYAIANDHNSRCAASGQCKIECSNIALSQEVIVRIVHSATPFWCLAPILEKLKD